MYTHENNIHGKNKYKTSRRFSLKYSSTPLTLLIHPLRPIGGGSRRKAEPTHAFLAAVNGAILPHRVERDVACSWVFELFESKNDMNRKLNNVTRKKALHVIEKATER